MRMTIKDIARLSGYGIGTVSRVLNNHPDVSEKARKKILSVIEENNFQPNSNARHLKMQSSSSVILIVKGTSNLLFADIVEQMQSLFLKNGENVSTYYIDEDANEVNYAIQLCRDRNPKGIVFLGGNLEYFKEDFAHIHIPCLLLTNNSSDLDFDNLSSVTTCDEQEISFRRFTGAKWGFKNSKLSFNQRLQYEPCRFSMEEGYQAAMRLLNRNTAITAIFAMSDLIALGTMRAIYDMGKRVPEDISIVGYDGIALSRYCVPRLTTVQQDTTQLAKKGVDLMLQRINYPYHATHKTTPFHLIEGESVMELNGDK